MPLILGRDDEMPSSSRTTLFGRERSLDAIFGGGTVANVLLWRHRNLSAAVLVGFSLIWFLFEVVEYHFLTLLCHIFITAMLILFIWSNGAPLFNRDPPTLPEIVSSDSAFQEVAISFYKKLNRFMFSLYDIACGKDLSLFILVIASLWILSIIASYFSTLNLVYLGFLCMMVLPALYERYEEEVDFLASKSTQDMKKLYKKFDSEVLNKIPRGPVKDKKFK